MAWGVDGGEHRNGEMGRIVEKYCRTGTLSREGHLCNAVRFFFFVGNAFRLCSLTKVLP